LFLKYECVGNLGYETAIKDGLRALEEWYGNIVPYYPIERGFSKKKSYIPKGRQEKGTPCVTRY